MFRRNLFVRLTTTPGTNEVPYVRMFRRWQAAGSIVPGKHVQVEEGKKNPTTMPMLRQNNQKYVVAEIRTSNPVFVCTIAACHTRPAACSCGFSYRVRTLFCRRKMNVFS